MAYEQVLDLSADVAYTLGGTNDKGENNPTEVEGYYLGSRPLPDKGYGPGTMYIFNTPQGNVGIYGKANLARLLTTHLVGQMVKVLFTGMGPKKKGKNPAYLYKVFNDKNKVIDVSLIAQSHGSEDNNGEEAQQDDTGSYDSNDDSDYTPPQSAKAPSRPALAPNAERQAKVHAALSGKRN